MFINCANVGQQTSLFVRLARRPLGLGDAIDGPQACKDHVKLELELIDVRGVRYTLLEESIVDFDPNEYRACGCFAFEVLDGLRLARLRFFGFLRPNNDEQLVLVKLRLLCHFSSRPLDEVYEFDEQLVAKEMAKKEVFCQQQVKELFVDQLEQICHLSGTLHFEGDEAGEALSLHGIIGRRNGPTVKRISRLFAITSSGLVVRLSSTLTQVEGVRVSFGTGWLNFRSRSFRLLTETSLTPGDFDRLFDRASGDGIDTTIPFTCTFDDHSVYRFEVLLSRAATARWHAIKVNGSEEIGVCLIEREMLRERLLSGSRALKPFDYEPGDSLRDSLEKSMLMALSDEGATCPQLVGKRAATMAQLHRFARKLYKSNKPATAHFGVPTTLVITTNAHQLQLEAMGEFNARFGHLEAIIHGPEKSMVAETASEFVDWFASQPLDDFLLRAIVEKMETVFENEQDNLRRDRVTFAIKPSAVEAADDENMISFLDVHLHENPEAVAEYIMRVWASQFIASIIQHRIEGGQPLNQPLAIILQSMIVDRVHGKLVTCDPTSGDQRSVLLIEPEYFNEIPIELKANSTFGDRRVAGSDFRRWARRRASSLQQQQADDEPASDDDDERPNVLTKAQVLNITFVALSIHQHYGQVQEVTWGLEHGGLIYVYNTQSIPLDVDFSDHELRHELDTPLVSECDSLAQGLWIEALPGPISYPLLGPLLTNEYLMHHFLRKFGLHHDHRTDYDPYRPTAVAIASSHLLLNLNACPLPWMLAYYAQNNRLMFVVLQSMFGRSLHEASVIGAAIKEVELSGKRFAGFDGLWSLYRIVSGLSGKNIDHWRGEIKQWGGELIGELRHTILHDKFELIVKYVLRLWTEVGATYLEHTWWAPMVTIWLVRHVLTTATNSGEEMFNYVEADINRILEYCCADGDHLGACLRRVVSSIADKAGFARLDDMEALGQLTRSGSEATMQAWKTFIDTYGGRSARELDPGQARWREDQLHWVRVLKTLAAKPQPTLEPTFANNVVSMEQLLLSLRTPLSFWRRFLLRSFLIPWTRRAFDQRRQTREIMSIAYDRLREAFNNLGEEMTTRGLLPEARLVYFLKHNELHRILNGQRERAWLEKARHRQRMQSTLEGLRFEELATAASLFLVADSTFHGNETLVVEDEEISFTGTPITKNSVEGARVAVAKRLDDVASIIQVWTFRLLLLLP